MKTQAKHTPGPCYYDTESYSKRLIRQVDSDRVVARIDDSRYPDKSFEWSESEMLAHGYLLAAAPELLEALRNAETQLISGPWKTAAKAAIAKAEGRVKE